MGKGMLKNVIDGEEKRTIFTSGLGMNMDKPLGERLTENKIDVFIDIRNVYGSAFRGLSFNSLEYRSDGIDKLMSGLNIIYMPMPQFNRNQVKTIREEIPQFLIDFVEQLAWKYNVCIFGSCAVPKEDNRHLLFEKINGAKFDITEI